MLEFSGKYGVQRIKNAGFAASTASAVQPGDGVAGRREQGIGIQLCRLEILAVAGEQTLGVSRDALHGIDIVKLHPEKTQDKLRELLRQADSNGCPVRSPPPVTMMINIPDRVLLIKVSKLFRYGRHSGYLHGVL